MAGDLVPFKPTEDKSAEQIADKESKLKKAILAWADGITDKVIGAVREDVALRFLDRDSYDDEELVSLDLAGREFDPIVDEKTGKRLTEAIEEFAEQHELTEKALRRVYNSTLQKKWAEQKQQQISTNLSGQQYGKNFMTTRHGVWTKLYLPDVSEAYVWRRICKTRIDPVALSRDTSPQRNWRRHFLVTDETGQFSVEIGNELLGKGADRAISILMRHGVHVVESDDARQHLATFLRYKPRQRIIRAPRVGWFEAKTDRWTIVLPAETLGDAGGVGIVLDGGTAIDHYGFHRSGTSEQWRQQVAAPLSGNSNIVLAVGAFLAAPLLRWADQPGGGFHIYGASKIGKTLIGAVGQSVWGKPYAPGVGADAFGFTWESTANRLGQRAVLRSDVGLYLDEIGIGDRKAIATAIYKLAGGLDKGRWGQAERDFSILFVSTGEPSLAEFLPNARPGQLVRLVDIPAAVKSDSAFETIAKDEIAAAGQRFYAAANECHGAVGYDWLRHLVALGPKEIQAELKRLGSAWWALPQVTETANRAHPQVVSVVNRFALAAAALRMAIAAGILPWSIADTDAAIVACMQRWLKQRGNTDAAGELLREIRRRQQTILATIDDRFIHLRLDGRRLVPASQADQRKIELDAAEPFDGFVKNGRILVRPDAWRRLWAGLDADAVKQHLLRTESLIPGPNGDVPSLEKVQSNAAPARFYVLAPAFIEARNHVTGVTETEKGEPLL